MITVLICSRERDPRVGGEDVTGGQPQVGGGEGEEEVSPFFVCPYSRTNSRHDLCHLLLKQVHRFGGWDANHVVDCLLPHRRLDGVANR